MVLTELWARGSAANSRKLNYVAIFVRTVTVTVPNKRIGELTHL
jgi:hypothetical protein